VVRTNGVSTDDVGFLLAKASAHFNHLLIEQFAAGGFPEVRASYGSVLVPLFGRDAMRIGELAAAARLSKQAMTGLVAGCERDGLVERHRDANDGRASVVCLSPRGRQFQAVATDVLGELDDRLREALGDQDRDALTRALQGVMQL
jgi:DNA-binding MarR family transcriptional regulator